MSENVGQFRNRVVMWLENMDFEVMGEICQGLLQLKLLKAKIYQNIINCCEKC